MRKNLRLHTALGAMNIIKNGGANFSQEQFGIDEVAFRITTDACPWTVHDRTKVRRTLDGFIWGTIETLGLPKFQLPAEYIASIIAVFVHPMNYLAACSWVSGYVSNEDLIQGKQSEGVEGFAKVEPSQVFALVIALNDVANVDDIAAAYSAHTGASIARLATNG